ncbi:MAG: nucleotidyltransferase domain-containing protein [Cyanobacteria bacterium J06626_18]
MNHGISPHASTQTHETLEQRQQIALQVATECDRMLRQKFGATQVILFGSLAGQSPWHWDSDVDLAVEGLTFEQWLLAIDAVRALMPDWLAVDLVRLETLNPAVRRRVFQKRDMTQNKFLVLKEHLDDEVYALEETNRALNSALAQVPDVPEDFAARALASYINDFYRCCKRMSERVAVILDDGLPQGENWHQALLHQLGEPGGEGRPPLWNQDLLTALDEYRRFRHVVHHKYSNELRPEEVLRLAQRVSPLTFEVKAAIAHFNHWLTTQSPQ